MRNFSFVELIDRRQFLMLEAYRPWTFYYWRVKGGQGDGEAPDTWNTWDSDTFGGAVMFDYGDPMELVSVETIEELVTRQEYTRSDDVIRIINQQSGGGGHEDRNIFGDSWNTSGPIAGSRIASTSFGEAKWSLDSTGTVTELWSGNYLTGPAHIRAEFDDPGKAFTSEPLKVTLEFHSSSGSFTSTDPLAVIMPQGPGMDTVTLYGTPNTDKLTVAIDRTISGVSKRVEKEISLGGSGALNRWMCHIAFFPTGIQFVSPGAVVIHNELYMNDYVTANNFELKLGSGANVRWINVDRVRAPVDK